MNEQAIVEAKNDHVVRKHAFYWRLVFLRLNLFMPAEKTTGFTKTIHGRRRRIYDKAETPWQRVKRFCIDVDVAEIEKRIAGINSTDLTHEITQIQQARNFSQGWQSTSAPIDLSFDLCNRFLTLKQKFVRVGCSQIRVRTAQDRHTFARGGN